MRKAGMLEMDGRVQVERALTIPALAEACSLVHDAYVEKNYIQPCRGEVRIRAFECMPEMATFVAKVDARIVAVTSIVTDSPDLGLPSDHVFSDVLADMRAEGGVVCEITNLAVDESYRATPVFLDLTRACFAHARFINCNNLFIAISPGHASFFADFFRFEPCGQPRPYSGEVKDIVQGMRVRVPTFRDTTLRFDRLLGPEHAFLHAFYFTENPYHDLVGGWDVAAMLAFWRVPELRELFLHRSRFLFECDESALRAIRKRWGDDTYWRVWDERIRLAPWLRHAQADVSVPQ